MSANWWEAAPLVNEPTPEPAKKKKEQNWWEEAPLLGEAAAAPETAPAPQRSAGFGPLALLRESLPAVTEGVTSLFRPETYQGVGTNIPLTAELSVLAANLETIDNSALSPEQKQKAQAEVLQKIQDIQQQIQANTPEGLNFMQAGVRGGLESLPPMLIGTAASVATRSPVPALATAGALTRTQSYGEARSEGLDPGKAALYADLNAAIEVGLEGLPTQRLLDVFDVKDTPGLKKKVIQFAIQEGATEQATTALQTLNALAFQLDEELANAESPLEAAKIQAERQAVTAVATIVGGGTQAAGVGALNKVQRDRLLKKTEEAARDIEGVGAERELDAIAKAREDALNAAANITAPDIAETQVEPRQVAPTPFQQAESYADKIFNSVGQFIPTNAEFKVETKDIDGTPSIVVTDQNGRQFGQVFQNKDQADQLALSLNNLTKARADVLKGLEPLGTSLRETMKGLGLEDVGLRLDTKIFGRRGEAMTSEGLFDPVVRQVFLAVDAVDPTGTLTADERRVALSGVLRHEVVHALRYLDLWKKTEWKSLEKAASSLKKQGTDQTYLDVAKTNYADQNQVVQIEEAIADMIRDVADRRAKVAGRPRTLSERAVNFFDKAKNALTGAGFQTYEDVINRFEQGVIGARQRGQIRTLRAVEERAAEKGEVPERLQRLFTNPEERNKFRDDTVQNLWGQTKPASPFTANTLRSSGIRESRAIVDPIPPKIKINEQEVPTRDSEGRLIYSGYEGPEMFGTQTAPTQEGLTNFWNWFGKSKATDKQGRPMAYYHGTAADITEFVPKQAGSVFVTTSPDFAEGFSFYSDNYMVSNFPDFMSDQQVLESLDEALASQSSFSPKVYDEMYDARRQARLDVESGKAIRPSALKKFKQVAEAGLSGRYLNAIQKRLPSSANLMPVYVKAENPFDYENPEHVNRVVKEVNRISPIKLDSGQIEGLKSGDWTTIEGPMVLETIKDLGFDSMYVEEQGNKNLAVFDPNQIKSAIGNNGQFSPTTPSIRESRVQTTKAPVWVSQKVWDLHEKSIRADQEESGQVATTFPRSVLRRNSTMASRRLLDAVGEYLGVTDRKAPESQQQVIDFMTRMNEESGRREQGPSIRESRKRQEPVSPLQEIITPEEAEGRIRRRLAREPGVGAPRNERIVLTSPSGQTFVTGKITTQDWLNRVQSLFSQEEIRDSRGWYRQLDEAFRPIFGNETPKWALAWLMSQKRASPTKGFTDVLRAADIAAGKTRVKGAGLNEQALIDVLLDRVPEGGIGAKLLDFLDSELGKTTRTVVRGDARGRQPAAIDVWAQRDIGFLDETTLEFIRKNFGDEVANQLQPDKTTSGEAQYEYGIDFYNDVAEMLNDRKFDGGKWTAAEVQAVGWVAMQRAMGVQAEFVRDIIGGNTRRISIGLAPGANSVLADKLAGKEIPPEVAQREIDFLSNLSGIRIKQNVAGVGAYLQWVEGAIQIDSVASPEAVDDFMDMVGYVFQQTEIINTRSLASGRNMAIDIMAPGLGTVDSSTSFFSKFLEYAPKDKGGDPIAPGFQQITVDGMPGIRLLNFAGNWRSKQVDQIIEAANKAAADMDMQLDNALASQVVLTSTKNDWSKDKDGQAYLDSLRNRGRLQEVELLQRRYPPSRIDIQGDGSILWGRQEREADTRTGIAAEGAIVPQAREARVRNPQLDTPEFQRFFKDSKAVDEAGEPQVFYHGTTGDIDSFRAMPGHKLIFASSDPNFASRYAAKNMLFTLPPEEMQDVEWAERQISNAQLYLNQPDRTRAPNVIPLYVSAKNPFDYKNKSHIAKIKKELPSFLAKSTPSREAYSSREIKDIVTGIEKGAWPYIEDVAENTDFFEKSGYDSVYVEEAGVRNLAVFNPNQLKSAVGNIGTFDITRPSIREARRRRPPGETPLGPTVPGPSTDSDTTAASEALNGGEPTNGLGMPTGPLVTDTMPDNTVDISRARLEPLTRRLIRTVEFFQSAPDKLRSGVGLTDIAKRIEDYYDTYAERLGIVNGIIREANKNISFGRKREALDTFEEFIRARENGRTDEAAAILNNASESDRQLIDAWNRIAEETGRVNLSVRTPNGQPMKVYDPNLVTGTYGEKVGGFRPIRAVKRFFPRTLRREVLEVMMNSDKDPALYNELLDALIASGRVETREEADNYLTKEWFSDEIKQDYFAGVEKARTDPLPEVFYDYSWDAATRYLRKWARRTSQIQYFGQEMGQFQKDWFDTNIPKVRDDETQEYLNEIKNRIYEIESFDFISNVGNWLNSLATATQLGNPVSASLNLLGGTITNVQEFGIKEIAKSYADLLLDWRRVQAEGTRLGILNTDVMNILSDSVEQDTQKYFSKTQRVSEALAKFTNTMLTFGGFNGAENVVRASAMLAARSWLNDSLIAVNQNPGSSKAKKFYEWVNRENLNAEQLILENGSGPETAKFMRRAVNVPQGSYKIDMTPVFVDTTAGRFFLKYQKFGTQINRFFYRHFLKPFIDNPTPTRFLRIAGFLGSAIVGGGAILAIREAFGYGDPGPDDEEIKKALENEDLSRAWALIFSRAWQNITAAGSMGNFGNYLQFSLDWQDQLKPKNPLSPPGLASIEAVADLFNRIRDQKSFGARDLDEIAENTLSFYRAYKRIGLAALEEMGSDAKAVKAFATRKEVREIRELSRRYSDEMEMEYKRRTAPGSIIRTPMTPINRKVIDALYAGDGVLARQIIREAQKGLPRKEREKIIRSIQSAARNAQPIQIAGVAPSREIRRDFDRWARKNLPKEKVQLINRVDKNYKRAARLAGLKIGE